MAATTYGSIIRDQMGGNGVTVLYGWGQEFQNGDTNTREFLDYLEQQQQYFRGVVDKTLTAQMKTEGPIIEDGAIGRLQFQNLDDILKEGDWRKEPLLIEKFLEAYFVIRNEAYKRPDWMDKILSELTFQ